MSKGTNKAPSTAPQAIGAGQPNRGPENTYGYFIRLRNTMNQEYDKNGLSKLYRILKRRYEQLLSWGVDQGID